MKLTGAPELKEAPHREKGDREGGGCTDLEQVGVV